jgi:SAM-dependent methyltransferase
MKKSEIQEHIESARAYEALFVPALFGEWAPRVLDAAKIQDGDAILDVACGTGILARQANVRTGAEGKVAGIDPGPGMIAVASELEDRIDWREGVAEDLPFPDESFDAVVSQFGMMFFTDRPKAIQEMQRVLMPGGRMAVLVWSGLDRNPAYAAEVELLESYAGSAAADALRAPYVLDNEQALVSLFKQSGVSSPKLSILAGLANFPSIRTMVEADLMGWLPVMGVNLAEDTINKVLEKADGALSAYSDSQGRAVFDVSAFLVKSTKS